MFNYSIVVILLYIINIEGLRWKSTGLGEKSNNIISLKSTSSGPIIDVYEGKQIIILKDMNDYKQRITINCYAVGYDNISIEYKFCKNKICLRVNDEHKNQELYISESKKFEGIQINIMFDADDKDYSANYHCEAYDITNDFFIQSNFIQLRDKSYWKQHLVQKPQNEKTIHNKIFNKNDLPIKLPCFTNNTEFPKTKPKWIFQEFGSPVKWSVCPVKSVKQNILDETTFTQCTKYTAKKWDNKDDTIMPREMNQMKYKWNFYVNSDGELIIFDYTTPDSSNITYALMCYVKKDNIVYPINTHVNEFHDDIILKGLEFSRSKYTKERQSNRSLLHQNIVIPARNRLQLNNAEESLFAVYLNDYSLLTTNYNWNFNNKEIRNDDNFNIDKFKVEFLNEINYEKEGNYSLVDSGNRKVFTISVSVDGPPSLIETNCLPPIKYLWENTYLSMRCRFNYRPNYFLIKLSSRDLREQTGNQYSEKEETLIMKKSENAIFKHDSNITSDHSITFIVSNKFGSFARSSTIYVLPYLESQIKDFPSDFSCNKPCSNSESHKIFCRIDEELYLKKELDVAVTWIINGRGPKSIYYQKMLEKYFLLDPISNDLELKPITSENKCGHVFKEFRIECRIILKFNDKSISTFFYNSSADKILQKRLTAIITFDEAKRFSLLWIIPIISIIIFIFVIILVIVKKKLSSKTFQITYTK